MSVLYCFVLYLVNIVCVLNTVCVYCRHWGEGTEKLIAVADGRLPYGP